MGKTAGKTETVSQTNVPSFQQPYVKQLLSEAQKLYQGPGPNYYPGQTVAPLSDLQQKAVNYAGGLASGTQDLFAGIKPAVQYGLKAYDLSNNPYVAGAAKAAIRPVMDTLTERVLPQLRSQAVATGGAGGSREGIAEGLATKAATQQALDTTARMYNAAYGQGLNTMLGTLGAIPGLTQSQMAPLGALEQVGGLQRNVAQQRLQEAFKKYMYEQGLPYQKLSQYADIVRSPFGGEASSTVTATPPDKIAQILGDLMAAGVIAPSIWNLVSGIFGGGK